jgi:glycosyltransferase involved in cell wall biosynthesis
VNILLLNVNIGKEWGWGGIESHSETLAAFLHRKGHTVIMGCWSEGTVKVADGLVLPSRRITIRNSGDITAVLKIVRASLRENIQVVVANGGREYWPAALAAKIAGAKVVFVRHQVDKLKKTTAWLINHHVDRVVAVSDAVRDAMTGSGISGGKIEVINNSVAPARFDAAAKSRQGARKELGIRGDAIVVGSIGKLHEGKGVFDLLRAFLGLSEKYPRLNLLYVGEGPERSALEQEIKTSALSGRVIFTGVRRDVERMYAAMDIFVLASSCDEAFGMVLIEAMAAGKPLIGTTVGGIPEIVEDGVSGILVPPHEPEGLARAISRYIDDQEFSTKVAREGKRVVQSRFSDEAMGNRFEAMLKALI